MTTFNNVFSDSLRNSPGAKRISRLINGHINSTKGHLAPDFRLTDIYGNEIALKDYYHKSNVLLVFWATWCVPCMAEMPVLKGIRKQYSNNDLVMIFMSTDVDSLKFKSTLQSQQMLDWINIPRNMDLYYDYGNRNSIPQVYLINRKGFTIYSRNEEDDDELKKLKSLLSRLIN